MKMGHFQIHGSMPYQKLRLLGLDPSEILDFSATVNPLPLPKSVCRKISAQNLAAYPDIDCHDAVMALSEFHSISPDRIVISAGMTETIFLLPMIFGNAVQFSPTYYDYFAAFKKNGKRIRDIAFPDSQRNFEKTLDLLKNEKFDLIIICNPNNPDGKKLSSVQIDELCRAFQQAVICIDESYQEMSLKCESVLPYVNKRRNLLVLKSLTKPFGIGGIRASYVVSSQKIIDRFKAAVLPWGVSSIAQRIIPEFFNEWNYYQKQWHEIQAEKERIICKLNSANITTQSSICPFFFVVCKDASVITAQLLEQYKISVRDCTSFGMPHFIRIMPSVESNNDRLIEVLKTSL